MVDWRASASFSALRRRAALFAQIRHFFAVRGVLEVDTPVLSEASATDPYLASFTTHGLYLHTSPEFPMKRLLAAGSGSIYQICKVFRRGEFGRWHHPEFTLLEWYRIGLDHYALMDEMDVFLGEMLGCPAAERISYQAIFLQQIGIDPFTAETVALREQAMVLGIGEIPHLDPTDRDAWLDLLLTHRVTSTLGREGKPTFLYDYPASQAALATVRPGPPAVAERFEVYVKGVELANGYHELRDAEELRRRFIADNEHRRLLGLPLVPYDKRLLAALEEGLPACAGVALGVDRLLMIQMGAVSIAEVLAFRE